MPGGIDSQPHCFVFTQIAAHHGAVFRQESRILLSERPIGGEEGIGGIANQIVENEVRTFLADFIDEMSNVIIANRHVALAQYAAARTGQNVTGNAVGFPSPDIIRACQEAATAEAWNNVIEQWHELLVGAGGFSYEEAANICGCAVGTIKSRVGRARAALNAMLADGDIPSRSIGDETAHRAILEELDEVAAGNGLAEPTNGRA